MATVIGGVLFAGIVVAACGDASDDAATGPHAPTAEAAPTITTLLAGATAAAPGLPSGGAPPPAPSSATEPPGEPALVVPPPRSEETPSRAAEAPASSPERVAEPGPPVSFADESDDAHGPVAHEALSQLAYDILHVGWEPVSDGQTRGYSTSITVAGTAREDGSYVSYGQFRSNIPGETCQLYHVLTPGRTSFANAFCGTVDAGTRRFLGTMHGREVTATTTPTGATVLVGTFDDPAIPQLLEDAGRTLRYLSAFTCLGAPGATGCTYDVMDYASSRLTYRV